MSDSALFTAGSALENQQKELDVITNNLANMNTTAFKRSKADFADLMYQSERPVGADAGDGNARASAIEIGTGAQLVSTSKIFTNGDLQHTAGEYDVALDGDGFFEVTLPDGSQAYTRAGDFQVNSQGQFTTSTGYQLQGNFPQLAAGDKISISTNGVVSVVGSDGATNTAQIQVTRFANPAGLQSLGHNLYKATEASGGAETGNPGENGLGSIRHGYLEKSNVNLVQEMVNMIMAHRAYEINSKSINTAEDMLATVNRLKS